MLTTSASGTGQTTPETKYPASGSVKDTEKIGTLTGAESGVATPIQYSTGEHPVVQDELALLMRAGPFISPLCTQP